MYFWLLLKTFQDLSMLSHLQESTGAEPRLYRQIGHALFPTHWCPMSSPHRHLSSFLGIKPILSIDSLAQVCALRVQLTFSPVYSLPLCLLSHPITSLHSHLIVAHSAHLQSYLHEAFSPALSLAWVWLSSHLSNPPFSPLIHTSVPLIHALNDPTNIYWICIMSQTLYQGQVNLRGLPSNEK